MGWSRFWSSSHMLPLFVASLSDSDAIDLSRPQPQLSNPHRNNSLKRQILYFQSLHQPNWKLIPGMRTGTVYLSLTQSSASNLHINTSTFNSYISRNTRASVSSSCSSPTEELLQPLWILGEHKWKLRYDHGEKK
jgi:hypothetical protein